MIQTLVFIINTKAHTKKRAWIMDGDRVEEFNKQPSWSGTNGVTYYHTARLITRRDRTTMWYARARFDATGNSEELS